MKKYLNNISHIKITIFFFLFFMLMNNQNVKAQYYQSPIFDSIVLIPEIPIDTLYMKVICYTNHLRSGCYLDSSKLAFITPDKFQMQLFFSTDLISTNCIRVDTINLVPPMILFDGNYDVRVDLMTFSSIDTIVDTISTSFKVPHGDLSIQEESKFVNLNLFPNPVTNQLNFTLNEAPNSLKLEIFNISGKKVKTQNFPNNSNEEFKGSVDTSELKNGMYFCKFSNGEKQLTRRFIKQ